MGIGTSQLVIIAIVILVLFGRGKISELMGDFGKGISSFKKGIASDDEPEMKTALKLPHDKQGAQDTSHKVDSNTEA